MQLACVKLDLEMFLNILPLCTNLASMQQGMEILEKIIISGLNLDVSVGNVMMDMYTKCGSIQIVHGLF